MSHVHFAAVLPLQVRKEALTTLSVLSSSLQCFEQPGGGKWQQGLRLLRSPALEVLITRRAATMKVGAAARNQQQDEKQLRHHQFNLAVV